MNCVEPSCCILALDEDPDAGYDGIRRINALRWLLGWLVAACRTCGIVSCVRVVFQKVSPGRKSLQIFLDFKNRLTFIEGKDNVHGANLDLFECDA